MTSHITRAADAIGDTLNQKTAQETLEAAARAALATTREPTEAMIAAASDELSYETVLETWRAMHDAMMEE
jgi:hypothetical protein